ncbi:MAG TPA: hypothetical protein ENI58_10185 [Nitrospirae bacterium]|mgnify:CR=1 FL=1|nr:hypothetical protein [Nitrospirota bacterium]
MINNYTAGGHIEAWCTKCRLELGHTIVAMVANAPKRVKCNTCNSQHNFRTKPSKKKRIRTKNSLQKVKVQEINYDECIARLTDSDLANATKYRIEGSFKENEIINHPKFGIGIVSSVIQINKIEILFKDGPKLLVQNRKSGLGA